MKPMQTGFFIIFCLPCNATVNQWKCEEIQSKCNSCGQACYSETFDKHPRPVHEGLSVGLVHTGMPCSFRCF